MQPPPGGRTTGLHPLSGSVDGAVPLLVAERLHCWPRARGRAAQAVSVGDLVPPGARWCGVTHELQPLHPAPLPLRAGELEFDAPTRERRQVVRPRNGEAIDRAPVESAAGGDAGPPDGQDTAAAGDAFGGRRDPFDCDERGVWPSSATRSAMASADACMASMLDLGEPKAAPLGVADHA
jgi:hypothetical protein